VTHPALARAVRRLADQQSAKVAAVPAARLFRAEVTTVTAKGARDGVAAAVKVTWRGQELQVTDYPDSYTPSVGHWVLCAAVDGSLSILHRGVGHP
jgi:hypothetical protein